MSIFKKILGVVIFMAIVFVPAIIILMFVDEINVFNTFVVYCVIAIFAIWGYIIISVRSMSIELHDAVESMKKQNAAIAYKLTDGIKALDLEDAKSDIVKSSGDENETKEDTSTVNLNPEEPLMPKKKKEKDTKTEKKESKEKVIDDNYDDFK